MGLISCYTTLRLHCFNSVHFCATLSKRMSLAFSFAEDPSTCSPFCCVKSIRIKWGQFLRNLGLFFSAPSWCRRPGASVSVVLSLTRDPHSTCFSELPGYRTSHILAPGGAHAVVMGWWCLGRQCGNRENSLLSTFHFNDGQWRLYYSDRRDYSMNSHLEKTFLVWQKETKLTEPSCSSWFWICASFADCSLSVIFNLESRISSLKCIW